MTSEQKVRGKYPNADIVHNRTLGLTVYAVIIEPLSSLYIGMGYTKSSAWVDAAKHISREPMRLPRR